MNMVEFFSAKCELPSNTQVGDGHQHQHHHHRHHIRSHEHQSQPHAESVEEKGIQQEVAPSKDISVCLVSIDSAEEKHVETALSSFSVSIHG